MLLSLKVRYYKTYFDNVPRVFKHHYYRDTVEKPLTSLFIAIFVTAVESIELMGVYY